MFREISNFIEPFLYQTGFRKHVVKQWIYRNSSLIVEFKYRSARFALEFTPFENDRVAIDFIERKHKFSPPLVRSAYKKETIAHNVKITDCRGVLIQKLVEVFLTVEKQKNLKVANDRPSGLERKIDRPLIPDLVDVAAQPRRVGVMSLPLNENIGGNLQAFALMGILKKMGHWPVYVNLRHPLDLEGRTGLECFEANRPIMRHTAGMGQACPNTVFTDKYIYPVTIGFRSHKQLEENADRLALDAIVVGSDQVWRPQYAKAFLNSLFLDFLALDSGVKRISYAASFGTSDWEFSESQQADASDLLKQFDAVSVREDTAVEQCRSHLGVNAEHVLDPTFLLDEEDYLTVMQTSLKPENSGRLLLYVLDKTQEKLDFVSSLSEQLMLEAYDTRGQSLSQLADADAEDGDISVAGWLAAFYQASFIITDSFHGVAFSILFNKPFLVVGNRKRGMARFDSILHMFGLEDRLICDPSDYDIEKSSAPIDWDGVNNRLTKLRIRSIGFLQEALAKCEAKEEIEGDYSPYKDHSLKKALEYRFSSGWKPAKIFRVFRR
ncbi:polysaccharide pyruvyl transferase family protein [uncultured Cohaesibacter sp.]|uniref:polysaccharide pyruvyl transferase family protein n=1 Tax=uncultured Cohaesibacter sp. TaxID=1002546 RepID=UPI0029C66B6E|nr:polysaccharide pyruvyl transferase family protein [uncultured Cohaesibacter sp.]